MFTDMKQLLAVVVLAAAACGSSDDPATGVTYYQHAKPIFDGKCVMCHTEAGIGGFSLETYEAVSTRAGSIKLEVQAGNMPPWPPSSECNEYLGNRSLSDEQLQTLVDWVDQGRLEGDAETPAPPIVVEQSSLSRVDRELTMPEPYAPTTTVGEPDEYRCFILPWNETSTRYISGFRVVPGNAKIAHHGVVFIAQPFELLGYQDRDLFDPGQGYSCPGFIPGFGIPTLLGNWTPGSLGVDFPAGSGLKIDPGSAIVLQLHYNTASDSGPDQSTVQLRLEDSVSREARTIPFVNPLWLIGNSMLIPAGAAETKHEFDFDPSIAVTLGGFDIYTPTLHMHQLGSAGKLSVKSGGQETCLLEINDWDYHWQGEYPLRTPVHFNLGDQLHIECHWDNTPENQPYIGGTQQAPRDVAWGERSTDEMCLGGVLLVPSE
jgi:hypothetical protein